MNLMLVFLTGLTVGGLTCLAVQGGLLASVIAAQEKLKKSSGLKGPSFATAAFLVAKVVAYTGLGALLGAFGSVFSLSPQAQSLMQLMAGIYMLGVALNLLNIHPIFRYFVITPPKFLTRLVKNQSQNESLFAPALLGGLTIFIPCGTTIAMEAYAISSANPFVGALTMFFFTLGTVPLFFGIGFVTSLLGEAFRTKFLKLAAVAVIYLGLTSVNGSLVAMGSPVTFETIVENFPISVSLDTSQTPGVSAQNTRQDHEIAVTSSGYYPGYVKVKAGEAVRLTLKSKDAYSCASAFRIPSLGISRNLKPNDTTVVEFTPRNPGKIIFTCSMGMFRGVVEAI